jgi:transmembrane sensor
MTQRNDSIHSTANARWQAAYWCLRLKDRRRLSVSEGLRFLAWVGRSPMHLHELLFFRRLDDWLTRSIRRGIPDPSNVTHVDFRRGASRVPPPRQVRHRIVSWGVAAAAAATLPVIFFLASTSGERADREVTTAHEVKTQRLEDGSEVSLGADSTLRVQFTDRRRLVQLPHGQATFNVAMDRKRPFVVSTVLVDIAAVESTFAVSIDTSVEVMVYEGTVAITAREAKAGAAAVTVKKGERYRVPVEGLRTIVADGGTPTSAERVEG